MLTAAVRDLKSIRPEWSIDVRTSCPELWENNPHLTELCLGESDVQDIYCEYPLIHDSNRLPYHFIHGYHDFLSKRLAVDLRPKVFAGDLHMTVPERQERPKVIYERIGERPYWVMCGGGKRDYTIKWWLPQRWQEVVDQLQNVVHFVQVGSGEHVHPGLASVTQLVGKTSLRELMQVIYFADGVVTPVSLNMHISAALRREGRIQPCVVIAGGREGNHWECYPGHTFKHTIGALFCCEAGGCWKARSHRLYDGDKNDESLCLWTVKGNPKCMDMIDAESVARSIAMYVDGRELSRGVSCV